MKKYFLDLIDTINKKIKPEEKYTAWFAAETMDYARFNQAKVRQAGTCNQKYLSLNIINGRRHATRDLGLCGEMTSDEKRIDEAIEKLRLQVSKSQEDPFLLIHEGNHSTELVSDSKSLNKEDISKTILSESKGLDLVGYFFSGPIYRGFANSFGQTNWFQKSSFVIDTSIYHSSDKAIKQSYADTSFNPEVFSEKVKGTRLGLELYKREPINISPGNYRVYFSPHAVYEILSLINWGGFSKKSLQVKNSPLVPLCSGTKNLSENFSLCENTKSGVGPNFQCQGFIKKDSIELIKNGKLVNSLICPRTAVEYKLDHNGADAGEAMSAMDMRGGNLKAKDILLALENGLYINNLWYLNFSDRQNGRLTGMTRFLCYVVKNGKPVAPFSVIRFDDSIYRIFGENLCHLTEERDLIIDNSTYDERSTACAMLPGIIAKNVRFTL